jgi:hypothetical protein
LAQTFPDSRDSDAGPLLQDFAQAFGGDPLAIVANFEINACLVASYSNAGGLALRVTVNVGQTFLHDAKDG